MFYIKKTKRKKKPDLGRQVIHPTNDNQANMVIGLLAVTAIPTVIGVGQAVSAQNKANAAQKEKAKFNIAASIKTKSGVQRDIGIGVLTDGKVMCAMGSYVEANTNVHPALPRPYSPGASPYILRLPFHLPK